MKTMIRLLLLFAVVAPLSVVTTKRAEAAVSFSISVFDGPLAANGYWIDRPGYGRCWRPSYVAASWRPYCEGYWMWTDYGWYWYSDEPWAWACYHYGRWAYDPFYGWIWVPGAEWGPSWVCWREGGGYVGWAPLPPACDFGPTGEIIVRDEVVRPRAFVFVETSRFCEPVRQRTVIINNTTIINNTVNITKVSRVNNVVVNNGPKVEAIQRVSTRKLTEAPRGFEKPVIGRPVKRVVETERITEKSEQPTPRIIRPTPSATDEKPAAKAEPVAKPELATKTEPIVKRPQVPVESEATDQRWLGRNRPSVYAPYPQAPAHRDQFQTTTQPDSIRVHRSVEQPAPVPQNQSQVAPMQRQPAERQAQATREDNEEQRRDRKRGDHQQQDN